MQEQDAYHEDDLYVWDESYQVYHNRIDDKHIIIFNLMQEPEENPADGDLLNRIKCLEGPLQLWGEAVQEKTQQLIQNPDMGD